MPFCVRINIVRKKVLCGPSKRGLPFFPHIEIRVDVVIVVATTTSVPTDIIVGAAGLGIGIAVGRLGTTVIIAILGLFGDQ